MIGGVGSASASARERPIPRRPKLSGGGTQILATHGHVIGPGGQTVMHDSDGDVLVYHYYDGNLGGTAQLGLNHLDWGANGWPTVVS